MEALDFDKTIEEVVRRDARFHREAYGFVRDALDYTQKNIVRSGKESIRHVSGQELLDGIRTYALQVYGPMAMLVLNEWGLQRCEDFGDIVCQDGQGPARGFQRRLPVRRSLQKAVCAEHPSGSGPARSIHARFGAAVRIGRSSLMLLTTGNLSRRLGRVMLLTVKGS
jgi:hypothetical protein